MSKRPPHVGEASSQPTCANCIHTFREKARHEMVVCVPHLKTMPASNASVCDLHAKKTKS